MNLWLATKFPSILFPIIYYGFNLNIDVSAWCIKFIVIRKSRDALLPVKGDFLSPGGNNITNPATQRQEIPCSSITWKYNCETCILIDIAFMLWRSLFSWRDYSAIEIVNQHNILINIKLIPTLCTWTNSWIIVLQEICIYLLIL